MPFAPFVLAVALAATPLAGVPTAVPVECEITDATLTWGFKESFRAYIDGDIANGQWTTAGDAAYETPVFTWSGGTGTYTPLGGRAEIAFSGSVRFTGHDGLLDTTIADPVVRLAAGSGAIVLDVSGPTMHGDQVDLQDVEFVDLASVEAAGDDAVRTVDADSALTADGSTAFPNYEAGTAFDPVSISINVGKQCPTEAVVDDVTDTTEPLWPLLVGIAALVVLVIAAGAVFFVTRRRRA